MMDIARYDVENLCLYWESVQSADGDELAGFLTPLARFIPGNIFVQYAFLDGEYVYAGSRETWVVWNWRQNEILNLRLEFSDVVHAVLLSSYLITVSGTGVLHVYWIPTTQSTGNDSPWVPLKALVKSTPFGTVRSATTLQSWIPRELREPTKICLKTTVISLPAEQPQRKTPLESKFSSFTLVFELSFDRYDQLAPRSRNPELLLPRLLYRGRGSFDWNPTYALSCDTLMEIGLTFERIPFSPSIRLYRTMLFECHSLDENNTPTRSYKRPSQVGGKLILGSVFDHEERTRVIANEADLVSLCLVTGRVVIIRPNSRSVEMFQFD